MKLRLAAALAATLLLTQPVLAGPPYATDDPEPTEDGRWEVYTFVDSEFDRGDAAGVSGLDINYGFVEDVQLTATVPFEFDEANNAPGQVGHVEMGVKWRLLDDERHGRLLAIFPRAIFPT